MAKSIAKNVVKVYYEINVGLSGKDLEKGFSIILHYLRLGMIKTDDVEFEESKIRTIRKICIKDNNVLHANKKRSSCSLLIVSLM